MNTPATHRSPSRLAVCGWDEHAREALTALEATGAFVGAAIGDRSGSALVRARRDTGLPCFQHVAEMVRAAEYDAILFAGALAHAEELPAGTMIAAARGAHLFLLAEGASGAALLSAATAATAHGVPLTLLQPAMHDPGLADLARTVAAGDPVYLDITVEAPTEADLLLRTAVGYLAEMLEHVDGSVRASAWAGRVYSVDLAAGDSRALIRARHAPNTFVRLAVDGPGGAGELLIRNGEPEFLSTSPAGDQLRYRPDAVDHWTAEAARAAHPSRNDDRDRAELQGTLLDAIARSVATGEPQSTSCCRRPELHLLQGGGRAAVGRSSNLRLVVS